MRISAIAILFAALITASCSENSANEEEAINHVRDALFDAESARFRNVHELERKGGYIVCGEVNAKNRMGGYTGYKKFLTTEKPNDVAFAGDDAEGQLAAILIDHACEFPKSEG